MKFYLTEEKTNRGSTWKLFVDEHIPVGCIETNRSQWKRGDYACYFYRGDYRFDGYQCHSFSDNEANTVIEARRKLETFLINNPEYIEEMRTEVNRKNKSKGFDIKYLPASEEYAKDFFPTPQSLAGKMLSKVRHLERVGTVLEPSAGLGDLAEVANKAVKGSRRRYGDVPLDIDVIEVDGNLQKILKAKEQFKLVHDDFLTYSTHKRYDLIVMNPPFSKGAEHLLKAMDMQRRTGGQLVCLLNAETIRNPYTIIRQQLANELLRLGRSNCSVEFVSNAFSKAKRATDVEVAIVYCNFPAPEIKSSFFEKMEKAEEIKKKTANQTELISCDPMEAMVQRYKVECAAGLALIEEYRAMAPYILHSLKETAYDKPIIELKVSGGDCDENQFLRKVRLKYWKDWFDNNELLQNLTTEVKDSFLSSVQEMADYEFSRFNLNQVLAKMSAQMLSGIESTIMKLFDELSSEHAYYPECKSNIWMYSGWKTNKAHKVNYKCIVPCYGIYTDRSWDNKAFDVYRAYSFLADIEKCLNYLDGYGTLGVDLERQLQYAANTGVTKNIHCKYFDVTFYKKGTCHITFTNHYIVDVLNIYAANNRSWLPPSYGKVKYEDMTSEEKTVIDEFQGKEAYEKVLENQSLYLYSPKETLPLLGA